MRSPDSVGCGLFLAAAVLLTARATVDQLSAMSTVSWDQPLIDVRQGDDVTVTCTVTGLDLLDVVRLVHIQETHQSLMIADNDNVKAPFSQLGRYRVLYHVVNSTATLLLQYHGIRGEDSGQLACYRLMDDENAAYVNVVVRVPVAGVQIYAMTSYNEEYPVETDGDVILQQHDELGVACVTSVVGSSIEPPVDVSIAGRDVTAMFESSIERRQILLESGLTQHHLAVRLALVTSQPDPEMNGKTLKCVARGQSGFADVEATTNIIVNFAPIVNCTSYKQSLSPEDTAVLTCTVKANPGSRVTWSTPTGDVSDARREPTMSVNNKVLRADVSQVTLRIEQVFDRHYGNYTLRADNIIGSDMVVMQLVRRRVVKPTSIRGVGLQQDANPVVAENHLRAPMTSSNGQTSDKIHLLTESVIIILSTSLVVLLVV